MAKIVISIPCPSCKFVKQGDCVAMTPTISEYIISTLKGE